MIYRNKRTGEEREFNCEVKSIYWEAVNPLPNSAPAPVKKKPARATKQEADNGSIRNSK